MPINLSALNPDLLDQDVSHKLPNGDSRYLELAVFAARFLEGLGNYTNPALSSAAHTAAYADIKTVVGCLHQATYELLNAPTSIQGT